ncbi:MAG: 30S ribosomal protein S5 [Candidatus Hodarchaeales archaeon]
MSRSRGRGRDRERNIQTVDLDSWVPRTEVGRMVKDGTIASIYDIFRDSFRIDDVRVVDFLVPNLNETVLDVGRVQRQTDAGRKTLFVATAGVGNKNGIAGVAQAKAAGVGTAIRNAIVLAKLNIVPVKRGCGSWECTCNNPHSIPFQVEGKIGSVRVVLKPAPKGLGLVIGDVAKSVLELAGISDIWSKTFGDTRTTQNFCKATFEALRATYRISHISEWGD